MEFDIDRLTRYETAHIRKGDYFGLNDDSAITLFYEVPLGAGTSTEEWLQENRKTIKDVSVDHQDILGVWRSVSIGTEQSVTTKGAIGVYQTFKKGWIQELVVGGEIVWDEARLTNANMRHAAETLGEYPAAASEVNNPQQYYFLEWHGVDPEKVDEIIKSIHDLTPVSISPVVNGEAIGTGFYILNVTDEIEQSFRESDKSAILRVLVGKPRANLQAWESYGTPSASKSYFLFDVPIYIAQTLINIYNKRSGSTATATAPDTNGLVNITVKDAIDPSTDDVAITETTCSYYTQTTYYYGIDEPPDVPENSMGVTYSSRFDLVRQEGKYYGWIEMRVRQTQHVASYRSENNHGQYVTRERWSGAYINGGTLQAATLSIVGGAISAAYADITLPDDVLELGETWQISKRDNADCTVDIDAAISTEKDVSDIEYDSADNAAAHTSATEKMNREAAEIILTASTNQSLRASVRYNKSTGLLDVTEEKTESKELEGDESTDSFASTRTVTRKRNTATEPAAIIPEVGKIKSISSDETEFAGRFNTTEVVDVAKNQTATSGSARADQTSTIEISTQSVSPLTPAAEEGKVINVSNRPNEYGLYSTSKETITPINQVGEVIESRADRASVTETNTQADVEASGAPISGKIVNATSQPTEFGKFRTSREVITPNNQIGEVIESRADRTSVTETNTQADVEADGDAISGKIVNATSQPTEFGKFRTSREVITPNNQSATSGSARADQISTVVINTQSVSPLAIAAEEGKVINVSNRPNEYGLYSTSKETTTPINQIGEVIQSRADRTSVTETNTQADAEASGAPVSGKIVNATSQPTEFGKFRTSREVITPNNQTGTGVSVSHTEDVTETLNTSSASPLDAPVETAGQIIDRSSQPTEFGTYRTTDRVRSAKAQTVEYSAEIRADQTTDRIWESNAPAKAEANVGGNGVITRANSQETAFGTFNNTKETITGIEQTLAYTAGGPLVEEAVTIERNAATAADIGAGGAGVINSVSSAPNAFGLYDNSKTVRTAKPKSELDIASGGPLVTSTEDIYRNNTTAVSPGAGGVGFITNVSNSINEFGLFDAREVTQEAHEAISPEYTSGGQLTETAETIKLNRLGPESPGPAAAGKFHDVTNSLNGFGLYDSRVIERTGIPFDSGWIAFDVRYGTAKVRIFRNQPNTAAFTADFTDETDNSLSVSINEYKLYDGSVSMIPYKGSGSATFWRSTDEQSVSTIELRTIEQWDSTSKVMEKVDQKRTLTRTRKSVITADYGTAENTEREYFDSIPADAIDGTIRRGLTGITDLGRTGWYVFIEWATAGAWGPA